MKRRELGTLRDVVVEAKQRRIAERRFERAILRARRAGFSLREIAAQAGISNVTVLNIERRAPRSPRRGDE